MDAQELLAGLGGADRTVEVEPATTRRADTLAGDVEDLLG